MVSLSKKQKVEQEECILTVSVAHVSSTAITLRFDGKDGCQYRARQHRKGYKADVWRYTEVLDGSTGAVEIPGLVPSTEYVLAVQVKGEEKDSKWQTSKSVEATTWSTEKEERVNNLERLALFLNAKLDDYPEDEHVPDTYLDKATRSFEGLLNVAGMVGVGGKWLKLAKESWKMRQYGLAALIFREDLQNVMVALGTHVGKVAEEIGISNKELILGSYYYFWERKRQRLIMPDIEQLEHQPGVEGVIESEAPVPLLEELCLYLPFARMPYRSTAAQVQWILRQFPSSASDSSDKFQLVCFRESAKKMRPSYSLVANRKRKIAILGIRGTKQFDDILTNSSFNSANVELCTSGKSYFVHGGMKDAAEWLLDGEPHDIISLVDGHKQVDGAGLGVAMERLVEDGYTIKLVGHSLGAGVAIILGFMLADKIPKLTVTVYAYATPCCVDRKLAEATKDTHSTLKDETLNRVIIKNFVNRDDLVSRLSMDNCKRFAQEVKLHKDRWDPFIEQDKAAISERAFSLWAPNQRTRPVKRSSNPDDTKEQLQMMPVSMDVGHSNLRLYIPGIIVHSYQYRGTKKASVVDYNFGSFKRIQPFSNMIEDHKIENISDTIRNILTGRSAPLSPPEWESISEEAQGSEEYTKCNVCKYFVGWNSSIGGHSEAVEVKGTYHCHACGKIVCDHCSRKRRALPEFGIISPCRVCDLCEYKLAMNMASWDKYDSALNGVTKA